MPPVTREDVALANVRELIRKWRAEADGLAMASQRELDSLDMSLHGAHCRITAIRDKADELEAVLRHEERLIFDSCL